MGRHCADSKGTSKARAKGKNRLSVREKDRTGEPETENATTHEHSCMFLQAFSCVNLATYIWHGVFPENTTQTESTARTLESQQIASLTVQSCCCFINLRDDDDDDDDERSTVHGVLNIGAK